MATVIIKENSKEATALLKYLRSLSFVEVQEGSSQAPTPKKGKPDTKRLAEIAQKMNKTVTKRMMKTHGLAE